MDKVKQEPERAGWTQKMDENFDFSPPRRSWRQILDEAMNEISPRRPWRQILDEATAPFARPRRERLLFTSCPSSFLSIELRPLQALDREDNADAYAITIATAGRQPLLVDGRKRGKVTFTVVGNLELDALFDGLARICKDLRQYSKAIRAEQKR